MKFSTNVRYAIRILTKLHNAKGRLPMGTLAELTGCSLRTIEKIHSVLRENGITSGVIGAKGGIELLIPLSELTLGAIAKLFDDEVDLAVCFGDKSNDCPNVLICHRHKKWLKFSEKIQQELDTVPLTNFV
ncbi:MAG: Rrf2 family transcriptional regulator [Deltaproteobacteria bacterium]|jgi:Rrf2 family iron-sulfur cluster assembly transcriptional regulator|nr:Rrf2 family transcriptional regulator [Deltaproteobacteria bacterium]